MKSISIISLLFVSLICHAQSGQSIRSHRVWLGIQFSADLNYRVLSAGPSEVFLMKQRNREEVAALGYTAGMGVLIPIKGHFWLETGLSLTKRGFQTRPVTLSWAETSGSLPSSSRTRFHYYYLSVPIKASYQLSSKRLRWFLSGGLSWDVFVSQRTDVISIYSDKKDIASKTRYIGVSRYNLTPTIGIRMDYAISKTLKLKIEPNVRYMVTDLRPGSELKEHLCTAGLNVGIFKRL